MDQPASWDEMARRRKGVRMSNRAASAVRMKVNTMPVAQMGMVSSCATAWDVPARPSSATMVGAKEAMEAAVMSVQKKMRVVVWMRQSRRILRRGTAEAEEGEEEEEEEEEALRCARRRSRSWGRRNQDCAACGRFGVRRRTGREVRMVITGWLVSWCAGGGLGAITDVLR